MAREQSGDLFDRRVVRGGDVGGVGAEGERDGGVPRAFDSPGSQHPVKQRPAGRVCVRCSATGAGPDAGRTCRR